jgi:predicted O-linked N-acetylglucosamine transferase (SPINDLY family)
MNGEHRTAAATSRQAPDNVVADLVNAGITHHQAGRLAEAEASYRQVLALAPDHSDALHLLGAIAQQAGRHDLAVDLIRQAIRGNGQNPFYFCNLGFALRDLGRIEEAVAACREAIRIAPELAEAHVNLGLALRDGGLVDAAVAAYREAIRIKPDLAEAQSNLGSALREQGKLDEAVAACREAIRIRPSYAEAYSNLGAALYAQGKFQEAARACHDAIHRKRDYAEAYANLATILYRQGRFDEALAACREAIRIKPDYAEPHSILGAALHGKGKLDEAVAALHEATRIKADLAEAHSSLGSVLKDQDKFEEAITACRQAIRIKPDYAEAHTNLGAVLYKQGRLDEAMVAYREAIRIKPDFAPPHSNLGAILYEQGRLAEASEACREAIRIKPDYAEAYCNLGCALFDRREYDEAGAALLQAIRIKPDLAEAHSNLGKVWRDLGQLDNAVKACGQAIRINPQYAEACMNLGAALCDQGSIEEAVAAYRAAVELKPEFAEAGSGALACTNYNDRWSPAALYEAHHAWGELHGRPLPQPDSYVNERNGDRRLRVGYVSPDFRQHSVAYFLEPLLRNHDRQAIEVFCFAEVNWPDARTKQFQGLADHWVTTVGMSDESLAERIRRDRIDILVDLAGHTAKNRLPMFAEKPAPVQATWLGYPTTTGLAAIDYRLVDAVTDPEADGDAFSSESMVRLPGGFLCYGAPDEAPAPAAPPHLSRGLVTFGSFNNPSKLSGATIDAWSRLLSRLPAARLLLKGKPFACAVTRASLLERLHRFGVAKERVELVAWLPDETHLALYNRIDIALDPFPYNGTTTTCEALWMGVPVVTLRGDRHAGRVGASLLTQVGLSDLIADSVETYIETAAALAGDPARLADLRQSLRPRMAASPLCDGPAFARKVEAAYRTMWQRWCAAPDPTQP